jgi:hypothetical protein
MTDALIILEPSVAAASRDAVARIAPATQSISDRVFLTTIDETTIERLRCMDGVANVITTGDAPPGLPAMNDAESLFVAAWLSSRGETKVRRGDGLDWDTPPMLPPDRKR